VDDPEAISKAVELLNGRAVINRATYWMNISFKFDKGKYSTCSRYLQHEWYLSQVEISSNIVFRSARFCTSFFERILDKFQRLGLPESNINPATFPLYQVSGRLTADLKLTINIEGIAHFHTVQLQQGGHIRLILAGNLIEGVAFFYFIDLNGRFRF